MIIALSGVWKNPDNDIEKLSRYRAVLSPDFSMYLEIAPVMQLYNVFRNRWCGAYWASKGLRVIPTVNWGDESTFDFCFEGIEKGSVVAVSTYMASEHDNRCDQKKSGSWLATMRCCGALSRKTAEKSNRQNQRMSDSGGEPGETKYTYTVKGELIETLIGSDGKAYLEIHHTDHGFPKYHEVPHQHSIIWDQSGFHFGKEQTTKSFLYGRNTNMATWVGTNSLEDNRFKTISDFK